MSIMMDDDDNQQQTAFVAFCIPHCFCPYSQCFRQTSVFCNASHSHAVPRINNHSQLLASAATAAYQYHVTSITAHYTTATVGLAVLAAPKF
jgi:hypothetical protein